MKKLVAVIGLCVLLTGCSSNPTEKFMSKYEDGDIKSSYRVYQDKIKGNEEDTKIIVEYLANEVNEDLEYFKENQVPSDGALNDLSYYFGDLVNKGELKEVVDTYNKYVKSRESFTKAQELFDSSDYEGARKELKNVLDEDTLYNKSELQNKVFAKVKENVEKEVKSLIDKHDYSKAIDLVNKNAEVYSDSKDTRIAEITKLQEEKIARDKQIAQEREERKSKLLNSMRTKYDEFKDITWYTDVNTTQYIDENSIHCYIAKSDELCQLRIRIQYFAEDWLFIEKYTIKSDNNSFEINTNYSDVDRDNEGGNIWEWYDAPVDDTMLKNLKSILNDGTVKIRHAGNTYHDDRTVTQSEINSMSRVIELYEILQSENKK